MTTNPNIPVPPQSAEPTRGSLEAVAALLADHATVDVLDADGGVVFTISPAGVGTVADGASADAIAFRAAATAWHQELTEVAAWQAAVDALPTPPPSSVTGDWIDCLLHALDVYIATHPGYLQEGTVSFNIKSYAVQPNIDLLVDGAPIPVPIDAAVIPADELDAFHERLTAAMQAKAEAMNAAQDDHDQLTNQAGDVLTEATA